MSRTGTTRATWIREQLLSPVGLHTVGFGILAIATIVLSIRVGLDWRITSQSNEDAIAGRQAELRALQIQPTPLRGLDKKVALSGAQIENFYQKRVPPHASVILEDLGTLQSKTGVRLTRAQYTQAPGSGDLTEIRIDAGLSGDYTAIMRFINGLERSQTFFIIRAMALTGQQSGTVNLRLQFSTWMRPADVPADMPVAGPKDGDGQNGANRDGANPDGASQGGAKTTGNGEGE